MTNSTNQSFSQQVSKLQFSQDAQNCFSQLSNLLQARSEQILEQSDHSPFEAWWLACCELLAPRQISVANVDYDGSQGEGEEDECIELVNNGPMIIDLGNWRLNAGDDGQDMVFPRQTHIMPNTCLTIHTRRKGKFSFNSPRSIWNNKGDTAHLYDGFGNEVCSYAYGNEAHSSVIISHIHFDGAQKRTEGDEYAEIKNVSADWIDLKGWQLSAGDDGQLFDFGAQALLKPHAAIRVYTNFDDSQSGGYSFNSATAVWNNKGDTGVLSDYKGDKVAQYSYGDKA